MSDPTRVQVQAAIDLWDDILTHHPNSDPAFYAVLEAARMWLSPNINAAVKVAANHRPGVGPVTDRKRVEAIVAAALTPGGDTDEH